MRGSRGLGVGSGRGVWVRKYRQGELYVGKGVGCGCSYVCSRLNTFVQLWVWGYFFLLLRIKDFLSTC